MSALLRYNARSPRHRYGRAQFTIHFIKEIKKLVPRALLSYIGTWEFRTLEKHKKHTPSARASPHFARVLKIPKCWYNSTMHLARFLYLIHTHTHTHIYIYIYIALYFYVSSPVKHPGKINTQTFYRYIYTHTYIINCDIIQEYDTV